MGQAVGDGDILDGVFISREGDFGGVDAGKGDRHSEGGRLNLAAVEVDFVVGLLDIRAGTGDAITLTTNNRKDLVELDSLGVVVVGVLHTVIAKGGAERPCAQSGVIDGHGVAEPGERISGLEAKHSIGKSDIHGIGATGERGAGILGHALVGLGIPVPAFPGWAHVAVKSVSRILVGALAAVSRCTSNLIGAESVGVAFVRSVRALVNVSASAVNASVGESGITIAGSSGASNVVNTVLIVTTSMRFVFTVIIKDAVRAVDTVVFRANALISVVTTSNSNEVTAFRVRFASADIGVLITFIDFNA